MYDYIIAGGGRAGIAAIEGIRELDTSGSILLVGAEAHLPYDRPPLTKDLWSGKKKVDDIFVHDAYWLNQQGVQFASGERVAEIRPDKRSIVTDGGLRESFGKLLIATGGIPRKLSIPGATLDGVFYFRSLDDYLALSQSPEGKRFVVIGGSFIGSEIAAALSMREARVTMVFPGRHLVGRVFPESLASALQSQYEERGIRILNEDEPISFAPGEPGGLVVETRRGERLECDGIVVGVGIAPETGLAEAAGLAVGDGVEVNEFLETSESGIYAAGDNANFPYQALGRRMRVEHWDNAVVQGTAAGRNMAGAREPFTYMPYFYSDLFEFGYEAVGEVSSRLQIFTDWEEENETGAIYYLDEGRVRGVMLCNIWGKLDEARTLIKSGLRVNESDLRGAVHS